MSFTPAELAAAPRWPTERTLALPGQARGDLLGAWGENLVARHGAAALARVQARVGPPHASLPRSLGKTDWVPSHAQPLLTEAIADELYGGDLRALYPAILDDTRKGIGRVKILALKAIGVARAFKIVPAALRQVHERGEVKLVAGADARTVRIELTNHPLFAQPTWRVLQLYATQVVLDLAGTPGEVRGEPLGDDGFACIATWH